MATKNRVINDIKIDLERFISSYMRSSELTLCTPDMKDAVASANSEATKLYALNPDFNSLSQSDKNEVQKECNTYSSALMIESYKRSLNTSPRIVNGQIPFYVDSKRISALDQAVSSMKSYVAKKVDKLISDCAQNGKCPNINQTESAIDNYISMAINTYAEGFSTNEKLYLKNHILLYKDSYINQYKSYAENVKITSSLPNDTRFDKDKESNPNNQSSINVSPNVSEWVKTNVSFSGTDMVVSADMTTSNGRRISRVIGSAQTVSYSIYRKLSPINAIGNMNAKDYVGGPRTIAGSIIFTVFNQHWGTALINEFVKAEPSIKNCDKILMDEIAPIDITISMANEYGVYSRLAIYGVRFFSEGQVMSINDVYTENTFQYVAMNIDYLTSMDGNQSDDNGNTWPTKNDIKPSEIKPIEDGGKISSKHSVTKIVDKFFIPEIPTTFAIFMDGSTVEYNKYENVDSCMNVLAKNYNDRVEEFERYLKNEEITKEEYDNYIDKLNRVYRKSEELVMKAFENGVNQSSNTSEYANSSISITPVTNALQSGQKPKTDEIKASKVNLDTNNGYARGKYSQILKKDDNTSALSLYLGIENSAVLTFYVDKPCINDINVNRTEEELTKYILNEYVTDSSISKNPESLKTGLSNVIEKGLDYQSEYARKLYEERFGAYKKS